MFLTADTSPSGGNGSGRTSSVCVSGATASGAVLHEVIDCAPGTSWLADRIGQLTRKHRNVRWVYLDPTGPIAAVIPDIERASAAPVHKTSAQEMAAACQRLHEDIIKTPPAVAHLGQDVLDAAVDGAAKRQLLDSWAWARRTSTSEISPLVCMTLGHWAAVTHPDTPLRMG
jgi:hypothetical protein